MGKRRAEKPKAGELENYKQYYFLKISLPPLEKHESKVKTSKKSVSLVWNEFKMRFEKLIACNVKRGKL